MEYFIAFGAIRFTLKDEDIIIEDCGHRADLVKEKLVGNIEEFVSEFRRNNIVGT